MSNSNLTRPRGDLDELAENTPAGMAYWAGSGPGGKTCRMCANSAHTGKKNTQCRIYHAKLRGEMGPIRFPADTAACKYFEEIQK